MFAFLFPSVTKADVTQALSLNLWRVLALYLALLSVGAWIVTVNTAKRDVSALAAVVYFCVYLFGVYLTTRTVSRTMMLERIDREAFGNKVQ